MSINQSEKINGQTCERYICNSILPPEEEYINSTLPIFFNQTNLIQRAGGMRKIWMGFGGPY